MRVQAVTMPKWGMTMTEGKVGAWLKAVGDPVAPGDELLEVETEKIANVVEAQGSGILRRILVQPGQTAAVGAPIALLADADATEAELDAVASEAAVAEGAAGALRESRVDARGLSLNVVSAGSGEGAPLVLLHGWASDASAWMFVQEALAEGRAVHALDLPSHGASEVGGDASIEALADSIETALAKLAPGRLHLAGHSLGGRVALRLAARLGDRVASLALIAPAGLGAVNRGFLDGFLLADRRKPMKEALSLLVADPSAVSSDMVERSLAAKRMDGATQALRALADDALAAPEAGVEADLAAAPAPLLLWGAEDRVIPPAPGATMIEGAGHMPHMERAAEVAARLKAHLEAHP